MTHTVGVERVTPQIAADWLAKTNTTNRKYIPKRAQQIANDIVNGRWMFSGTPLVFADTGELLDGQHRLGAIVLANITLDMAVVRGVPKEVFHVIDTGKGRTVADMMYVTDTANPYQISSLARLLCFYEKDRTGLWNSAVSSPTKTEIALYAEQHMELLQASLHHAHRWKELPRWSGIMAGTALIVRANGSDVFSATARGKEWDEKLSTGTMIEAGSAIHSLVRQFRSMKTGNGGVWRSQQAIMLLLRAWEYHCTGKSVEHLRVSRASLPMQEAYVIPTQENV